MNRYYYISENLDDLEQVEKELEVSGLVTPQIHVVSKDDSGVRTHNNLHSIRSVFKTNVAHGMIRGAWIGLGLSALVLLLTYYSNWPADYTWVPFIFLAVVALGFSAWVGGLIGIQVPHKDLRQFEAQLKEGKHLFIVDIDKEQKASLDKVVHAHPGLQLAGEGVATPRWVVMGQHSIKTFATETFP